MESPWNSSSSPHLKIHRLPAWGRRPLFFCLYFLVLQAYLGAMGTSHPEGQLWDESHSHMLKKWDLWIKKHCFGNSNLLFRIWTGILVLKSANNSSFIWQQNSSLHLRKRAPAWELVWASSMGWDRHRVAAGAVTMETDSSEPQGLFPRVQRKCLRRQKSF